MRASNLLVGDQVRTQCFPEAAVFTFADQVFVEFADDRPEAVRVLAFLDISRGPADAQPVVRKCGAGEKLRVLGMRFKLHLVGGVHCPELNCAWNARHQVPSVFGGAEHGERIRMPPLGQQAHLPRIEHRMACILVWHVGSLLLLLLSSKHTQSPLDPR